MMKSEEKKDKTELKSKPNKKNTTAKNKKKDKKENNKKTNKKEKRIKESAIEEIEMLDAHDDTIANKKEKSKSNGKNNNKLFIRIIIVLLTGYIICCVLILGLFYYDKSVIQKEISKNTPEVMPEENKAFLFEVKQEDGKALINEHVIVFDGLTYDELVEKLNKSLSSTLTGTGNIFATACLEYNVNPYLAVAIALHETGCKWTCSVLVRECNNVGGVKGSPSCNGGSYRAYPTLEDGITKFVANIGLNYVDEGLTTAEAMQSKYAGSTSWAGKVNNYIESIQSK